MPEVPSSNLIMASPFPLILKGLSLLSFKILEKNEMLNGSIVSPFSIPLSIFFASPKKYSFYMISNV